MLTHSHTGVEVYFAYLVQQYVNDTSATVRMTAGFVFLCLTVIAVFMCPLLDFALREGESDDGVGLQALCHQDEWR